LAFGNSLAAFLLTELCLGHRHSKKSRPVGYGLIGAAMRADSMIGVTKLPSKELE
jgi:hypothetical protein